MFAVMKISTRSKIYIEIELYMQRDLLNLITHHYPHTISLLSHQVDLQI